MIADTPEPPYYAVIFTSERTPADAGYSEMSEVMIDEVKKQPGFLGFESARDTSGITVSYWKDYDAVLRWRNNLKHREARKLGKSTWYTKYKVRICKVERDYAWNV